ncbi:DUF6912 family protein [Brevibacterium spongiae]|uniref:Uncharacterized protein n=1 Tax=Brevibacterium spongiae TaxID=2909672 RepID=A0ABY5SWB7_9MICO|nr:hypothetical protein [Brevibacterium spongiae]UVI37443.1 hypothetical protein L1F31_07305 [Brevibacterium spongiae]
MAIRCYIPTTLTALRTGLTEARAVAPDEHGRSLRGEELETAEFDAMCIAAALAADAAFEPAGSGTVPAERPDEGAVAAESLAEAGPAPRVIVAYDAPESSPRRPLSDGFELISIAAIDMAAVASFHLDEEAVWDEAVELGRTDGAAAAESLLGESDLLWYDATELDHLLGDRS